MISLMIKVKLIWNIIYIIFTQKDAEIYKKFRRRIHSVHYYDSVVVLELNKDDEISVATVRK